MDWSTVTQDGVTILHLGVVKRIPSFFKLLAQLGLLSQMYDTKVANSGLHVDGLTALETAKKLGYAECVAELQSWIEWEKSLTWLHRCVRFMNLSNMDRFLNNHSYLIEKQSCHGETPLLMAVAMGNLPCVQRLVKSNAKLTVTNGAGQNIVDVAVQSGHSDILKYVLDDCNFQATEENLQQALYDAMKRDDLSSVVILLQHKAVAKDDCIPVLFKNGSHTLIECVLNTFSLNLEYKDDLGRTAVMYAVEAGKEKVVEKLLQRNVNLLVRDIYNNNIVHMAVMCNKVNILFMILTKIGSCSVLINEKRFLTNHLTLRHIVSNNPDGSVAYHIMNIRRVVLCYFDQMMYACDVQGDTKNPNNFHVDQMGQVLHTYKKLPLQQNDAVFAQHLLEKKWEKADLSPLNLALLMGHKECAMMLIQDCGSSILTSDYFGLSPIHMASMRGLLDIVTVLKNHGANVHALDRYDHTPFDVALLNNHRHVCDWLSDTAALEGFSEPLEVSHIDLIYF